MDTGPLAQTRTLLALHFVGFVIRLRGRRKKVSWHGNDDTNGSQIGAGVRIGTCRFRGTRGFSFCREIEKQKKE